MTTRQKLEIIQKRLCLTQTRLAERFGVSFVAFNGWWTGKTTPRPKMRAAIEELYLEVTGQKIISAEKKTATLSPLPLLPTPVLSKSTHFPTAMAALAVFL